MGHAFLAGLGIGLMWLLQWWVQLLGPILIYGRWPVSWLFDTMDILIVITMGVCSANDIFKMHDLGWKHSGNTSLDQSLGLNRPSMSPTPLLPRASDGPAVAAVSKTSADSAQLQEKRQ